MELATRIDIAVNAARLALAVSPFGVSPLGLPNPSRRVNLQFTVRSYETVRTHEND